MATSLNKSNPWIEVYHSRPRAKYQVFIFPSAGSPDPCYRDWDENFPEYEFSLIIYPGRAARFGEKLLSTIKEYVTQLQIHLLPNITKPCIFIGHSIGSAISFALAKHMIETKNKGNLIKLMVQMGRGPPHLKDPDKSFSDMTDKEIIEDLKKMADPKTREIYDYPSVVQMLIPTLKADAMVGDELLPLTSLDIPIIVYGGDKEETVKEPFLKRWEELTTKKDLFRVRMFSGHHNFQSECQDQVVKALKEDLNDIINTSNN